jgi:hypothetical protein
LSAGKKYRTIAFFGEANMPKTTGEWFIIGMGLIGAATGFLVAESRSPVVAVALPLIFGLIGGAGGIYVARADLTSEAGRSRLALIGKSISALSAALIVMAAFVLWMHSRDSADLTKIATDHTTLGSADLLDLAELRTRLKILGASADEQQTILNRAIPSTPAPTEPVQSAAQLRKVSAASMEVLSAFTDTKDHPIPDQQVAANMTLLQQWLTGFQPLLNLWAEDLKRDVPSAAVNQAIDYVRSALSTALTTPSPAMVFAALSSHPMVADRLIRLEISLSQDQSGQSKDTSRGLTFVTPGSISDRDQFLRIILGADPLRGSGPPTGLADYISPNGWVARR